MPIIRKGSNISLKINLPAIMMATVLNPLSNIPSDNGSMESKTNHNTNSKQKQNIPTQSGKDDNMLFQRRSSLSLSVTAAYLNAICPVVSTTIFNNQTKMASVDKESLPSEG